MTLAGELNGPQLSGDEKTSHHAFALYVTVLIIMLMLVSGSWVSNRGADWIQITLLVSTFGFAMLRAPLRSMNARAFYSFAAIFVTIAIIPMLRPDGYSKQDILFLVQILVGFIAALACMIDYRQAFRIFARAMYWLTLSSLLLFPLVFILPELLIPVPDIFMEQSQKSSGHHRTFYTLFGISYFASGQGISSIWRNQSIFWEPGMFGFMGVVALALSDAIGGSRKEKAVFALGVVSTFAPGAYGLLALYFGIRLVRGNKRGIIVLGLIIAVYVTVALSSISLVRAVVQLLFDRDIYNDSSVSIRSTDLWLPYVAALKSPLFGQASIEPYENAMSAAINKRRFGITNSVGAYFYRYGYPWALAFIAWAFYALSRGGVAFSALPFILFFGLMYEPLGFSSLFLFLLFLAVAARSNHTRDNRAGSPKVRG